MSRDYASASDPYGIRQEYTAQSADGGQTRFDVRCIVHSGLWFPEEMRGDRCEGVMLEMDGFWQLHQSGDLTGYICRFHADWFLRSDVAITSRLCWLRESLTKARQVSGADVRGNSLTGPRSIPTQEECDA